MSDVFDLTGELPTGTTVLEASAGTGKTHTIAALAARYVAEGVARIDELMLVTFGRAATVELRERVRERLVAAAAALADPETARASADEVERHLATGPADVVDVRRGRLAHAVANFDAATIATTHGFCHQMLAGLGVAADVDGDLTFTETASEVVAEVAGDLYLRAYARPGSARPPITYPQALTVSNAAVADRQARLEPVDADPDTAADVRRRLADRVRTEVAQRKRSRRVMDYDDLLVHLRDALVDPSTGADARSRVRSRYRVVLVDEFQDTDPVQWEILESAFHGHRTLVLIGDPKQAIYAFRGADVVTYLHATGTAAATETLGTNWRSDAAAGRRPVARPRRRGARRRADHRPPGRGGPRRTPAARRARRQPGPAAGRRPHRAATRAHRRAGGQGRPPVRRPRRRRRHRPAAVLGGGARDGAPAGRATGAPGRRGGARAAQRRRRHGPRHAGRRRCARRPDRHHQRLPAPTRPTTGWPCSRRWSSRSAPGSRAPRR